MVSVTDGLRACQEDRDDHGFFTWNEGTGGRYVSDELLESVDDYPFRPDDIDGFFQARRKFLSPPTSASALRAGGLPQPEDSEAIRTASNRLVIVDAPGATLARLLPYFFGRKTIEHVFMQAIADMREEYFEAVAAKRVGLARAIVWRWRISVIATVISHWGVSIAKKAHQIWKLTGGGG